MAKKPNDIEAIYNAALNKASEEERAAYLDSVCGDDHVLRARIESLLKAHEEAGDFLEVPAFDPNATLDNSAVIEGPGTRIGRYELLELIGEGGMGLVYLAQQKEPVKRRVALKIVKLGMDTKQVVARFEAERQTLALLEHPNIAHVFDAGTTEAGRPYFVMEYVKGTSITRYCDERKLNIEQRLRLFEQVCEAVHHAHQKGIIHRDIKPSNILVSIHGDKAVPKIIDFGIAKAITQPLTEKTFFTHQGQLLGTPEYMSPEQVDLAIQDIDTRSDIYSLGVVLYELLAGVLPFERESFERAGFAEIQQTIRGLEPASPSIRLTSLGEKAKTIAASRGTQVIALARRLHRELEWIPLKAMRKDRCRRYKSASEMADDIRNYLNGNPLIAGPETAMYRVRKFVRKHAGSVATAALVAVAILLGLVISTAMYFRAEQALEREAAARVQAEQARVRAENAERIAQEQRKLAEERAEDYRRALYVNHLAMAKEAYSQKIIRRVGELLESCPADLRGWEWYRLRHIADQSSMTLHGHDGEVWSIAFSPDSKCIISCSDDDTIKVWDAATGAELMTLRGHGDCVGSIAFSPDGKRIVSGSDDKTIKIWDAATGVELMTLRGHKELIETVAFSPDGRRIVSASDDKTVKVWDAVTGDEVMTLRGHEGGVYCAAISRTGDQIVSGSLDGTIKVWDAATGAELMTLRGHEGQVYPVAFSPDGKRIVSGGEDKTVKVWDAATGEEVMTLRGHKEWIESVAFSPDGRRIVSGSGDNTSKLWDAPTGAELTTLVGHSGPVNCLAFSQDGERIVSGSEDETIKVWDPAITGDAVTLSGHQLPVISIAFSPDGKRIVSGGLDRTIKVWDAATGAELMTLRGHKESIASVAFSPDGKRIVSGGEDKTVKVWDVASGAEAMTLRGHEAMVFSVGFSPDGKRIVSGSYDETIKVWDAATGVELMTLRGHKEWIASVAFSPDGKRIVSGSKDKTVKVWDVASGAEAMTLRGHESEVWPVAFSPDGKRIVSGSYDETIKVWDAATGAELMTLRGHKEWIASVAFSPDGKRIVSGDLDGTIKVWDAATGAELMTLLRGDEGVPVAFSPDGKTIGAGSYNIIKLWESTTPAGGYEPRWNAEAARKVVDQLYKKHGFYYYEVIDKLEADKTLAEPVRKLALQIANSRLWEDTEKLKKEGWEIVSSPGGEIEAYRLALGKLEMANRLEPNDRIILANLGVAQYRVGAYQDALTTMIHVEKMRADANLELDPIGVACIAMALRQLGQAEEAQAALNRLRGLFAKRRKTRAFVIEAEKLFAGEDSKLYSVWEYIEAVKLDEAAKLIEELRLSDDPNIADRLEGAVKWLGRVYYRRGKSPGREYAEAIAYYEAAVRIDPNRARALNDLARLRAACPAAELRDGAKAVGAATKACELTNWKKAHYVGTLAAAYAETGDFDSAVKRQKKAIDLLTKEEEELRADFEERLKLYESGKPYRESP